MPEQTSTNPPQPATLTPAITTRVPPGHRALYVSIPATVFNHAKAQAYLSDMRWPDYIQRLLAEAKPYTREAGAQAAGKAS